MSDEKKPEKTASELRNEALIKAFPALSCCIDVKPVDCSQKMMIQLKVSIGEDGKAYPDESDLFDLDALIQTYKDQCGMEGAKRMLKQGVITLADLQDDGKGSYDGLVIPESAQDRANAAVVAQKNLDAVKAKYGIDPTQDLKDDQIDAVIKAYIEKNLDKFVAKKATETPKFDNPKGGE